MQVEDAPWKLGMERKVDGGRDGASSGKGSFVNLASPGTSD